MSKGSWMWGGRRTEEAVRESVAPHRSKKDRKRWCKGKVGVPHMPELVLRHDLSAYWAEKGCHWSAMYGYRNGETVVVDPKWWWRCKHAIRCRNCGKYIKHMLREECPEWRE